MSVIFPDFRRRAIALLGYEFSKFHPALVLNLLQQKRLEGQKQGGFSCDSLSCNFLDFFFLFWITFLHFSLIHSLVIFLSLDTMNDIVKSLNNRREGV